MVGFIQLRRRPLLLSLAAASIAAPSIARAQGKVVVPFATWGSPTHVNIVSFLGALEAALQRDAGGRITVRHYPAGQLAQDVDMPIAIPTGKVKFGWITVLNWTGLIRDVGALSLPTAMTMESGAQASDMPGGFKEVLDKQFRERGATLLAMTDIGSPAIASSKKIVGPDDMKGLRVRAPSEGLAELVKQLGGAPVAIPFGEVYTALQHGTIDAAVIGFQGIQSQRVYEVSKFAIVPGSFTGMGMQGFAANLQWWMGLNPKDREIIAKAIREAELASRAAIIKDRAGLADQYRQEGMDVTMLDSSMPQFAAWKQATDPLLAKGATFSKEIMAPILAAGNGK
ncbi:TRAP transporter substrate-binding protein [Vineibacter terrae]|uniref:TRAP transporter substrate-binding protein n=1 Tax=Vineibacter terrae TaxID=2586908 RepID=A0A5C8PFB9_9HYPH|nr:TRAP transporter substrate-binding protein [Vineibacter terrae]